MLVIFRMLEYHSRSFHDIFNAQQCTILVVLVMLVTTLMIFLNKK